MEVAVDERYPIGRMSFRLPASVEERRRRTTAIAELPAELRQAVAGLTEAQLETPYRGGGWTVRQVVHHLADSHAIASTRFRLALGEVEPRVRAYDEKALASLADARRAPAETSLALLEALHARWVDLLGALVEDDFRRCFLHDERGRVSLDEQLARSAWHGEHHVAQIASLRQRKGW